MSLARSPLVVALLVTLLLASLQVAAAAGTEATRGSAPTPELPPPPLPKIVPPPVVKPAPDFNGRTDLPNGYEQGAIKLKVRAGLQVNEVFARHGLTGAYRHLSPPPFTHWDLAVGIDRNFRVEVPTGREKALVAALSKSAADFEWVHMVWLPNGAGALLAPNDPKYTQGNQSYLGWINMESAWDRTVSSSAIVIAVLDSGLYAGHEDSGVWKQRDGWDYLTETAMPKGQASDSGCAFGHGTKVSTMAAADTNQVTPLGMAGTGFNSGILPEKVLRSDCSYGATSLGSITYDWPIRWATSQGAHIINMSYDIGTYLPPEMQEALAAAWSAGVTPVAGAGNGNRDHRVQNRYPCDASYVICVGAVQSSTGTKWSSSDYGPGFVDVMAPGYLILGATNQSTSDYRTDSGTSYASPLTAGVFALLRSLGKSPDQQWSDIAATAQYPGGNDPNQWSSYGLINAGAALWR